MTLLILRFFHILFMATWFGAAMFLSSDLKSSLAEPRSNLGLLQSRV